MMERCPQIWWVSWIDDEYLNAKMCPFFSLISFLLQNPHHKPVIHCEIVAPAQCCSTMSVLQFTNKPAYLQQHQAPFPLPISEEESNKKFLFSDMSPLMLCFYQTVFFPERYRFNWGVIRKALMQSMLAAASLAECLPSAWMCSSDSFGNYSLQMNQLKPNPMESLLLLLSLYPLWSFFI